MRTELSFEQTRVIGALIEKQITTPDQYPLSLNSCMLACNQKSNREPVVQFSEGDTQHTLDQLEQMALTMVDRGGRVNRYKHRFCNTEFASVKLSPQQLGIICVLFLRGPQTPGELRTRTQRLCEFTDVNDVETCLNTMAEGEDPLVVKLPREAGKRESRYMHLYSGQPDPALFEKHTDAISSESQSSTSYEARITKLEETVAELQQQLSALIGDDES